MRCLSFAWRETTILVINFLAVSDKFADFKEVLPEWVNEDNFEWFAINHSAEHVFAQAISELFPGEIKLAVAHLSAKGFANDASWKDLPSDVLFEKIEAKMQEIIDAKLPITREEVSLEEAQKLFAHNPFKLEWVNEHAEAGKTLTVYRTGDRYVDLCKGPHVGNTGEIGAFKLLSVAGAYWRGDEKNEMLSRVYGVAFATSAELEAHLEGLEEAKRRDHRKLGKELDLFTFSELVGSGLPLFTPRGTLIREALNNYSQGLRLEKGYQKVWIPHMAKSDLYKKSGHWDKFGDELFLVKSQETDDVLVLKPMNCPHHQQIYASKPRSYRDLPIKYLETTTIYRDEKAGELNGLSRVRSANQDDSHTFCTPDQLDAVVAEQIEIISKFYSQIGMKLKLRVSYRDPKEPEKYLGEDALWEKAQGILLDVAKKSGFDYYEAEGEAAFYGPKVDFMATDALGREWQVATSQLDFVQPERFELTYTDSDGVEKTPVMIHFALMGSLERFMSVYIEHTAGAFPAWVAPEQVRVIPISEQNLDYAKEVQAKLVAAGVQVQIDSDNDRMGNKIRKAQEMKVPYMLIMGKMEAEKGTVSVRLRSGEEIKDMPVDEFVGKVKMVIATRALDLTL